MNYNHEAIFCIVNSGYSEAVMDAAKKLGARGGTVINARGTAPKDAETFFGITIQPEKEIVLTVVDSKQKKQMMEIICERMSLEKQDSGICFSLPINNVIGIAK